MTAQTLQRTEIYEAERQAALELQRELLPQDLAPAPGWDVAAHYAPAGEQEAGGDFYDVLPFPDGRVVAVVGDVMGRGVQAAAAMAQIRSTIRAYVISDPDPIEVFNRVDKYFAALDLGQLVTVLYLLADHTSDVVQIANAGHLPPILIDGGQAAQISVDAGIPFGVNGGGHREVTTVRVPKDASIAVVTDGLVERRGEDIDDGIARLLHAARGVGKWSARRIVHHIVESGPPGGTHDDDVTVLVMRRL